MFVIVPVVILPYIYTHKQIQVRGEDIRLNQPQVEDIPLDTPLQEEQSNGDVAQGQQLMSSTPLSHQWTRMSWIPRRYRGSPPSMLYGIALIVALVWYATYLPEYLRYYDTYIAENFQDLINFTQRMKIVIVYLFLCLIAATTVYHHYTVHIAYVVALAFTYVAFPFSLGVGVEYCFPMYIDPSQPWIIRSSLLAAYYVIATTANYMFRMSARNSVSVGGAVAMIFGWNLFEDVIVSKDTECSSMAACRMK